MNIVMNGAYINSLDDDTTLANTLNSIMNSTTTDYIIFSLTVPDPTSSKIQYGLSGPILASEGALTPTIAGILAVVAVGVALGKCQRVWLSIGGAGTSTFSNIVEILNERPITGLELMGGFKALYKAIAAIPGVQSVGFDLDDEEPGDVSDALTTVTTALYQMMKCPITFCPYQNEEYWVSALVGINNNLNFQPVIGMNLQVYSGGSINDPTSWTTYLNNNLTGTGLASADGFILPIQSMDPSAQPTQTPAKMTSNLEDWNSAGGSFWATAALPSGDKATSADDWAAYSNAIAKGIGK